MCLKTSSKGRNNPKTDINVYKVLLHLDDGRILAPFTFHEYKLDRVLIDQEKEEIEKNHAYKLIGSGYFHACTSLYKAKELAKDMKRLRINGRKILIRIHRAIIPCKTKYYTNNKGSICAKSIKVLSVCV